MADIKTQLNKLWYINPMECLQPLKMMIKRLYKIKNICCKISQNTKEDDHNFKKLICKMVIQNNSTLMVVTIDDFYLV